MLTAKSKKRRKKMEKEKQQSSIRLKIVALVISLLVCFTLIGISVWAATQQNVTIDNTITITTAGNTRVQVKVSEYLNAGTDAISASPESISSWSEVGTKTAETNSDTINPTAILFSLDDGHNYYAYKIDFTNQSVNDESDVITTYAHISSSAVDNAQLTIYHGASLSASMQTLANNTALDIDVTLDSATETSFYIVVAVNEALGEMTPASAVDFDLSIAIDRMGG